MSLQDLKAAYSDGRNRKGRQLINAAIRAELPGGTEVLDALALIQPSAATSKEYAWLNAVQKAVDAMADAIARKYDLKSARD